jgi:hypothetical protein
VEAEMASRIRIPEIIVNVKIEISIPDEPQIILSLGDKDLTKIEDHLVEMRCLKNLPSLTEPYQLQSLEEEQEMIEVTTEEVKLMNPLMSNSEHFKPKIHRLEQGNKYTVYIDKFSIKKIKKFK